MKPLLALLLLALPALPQTARFAENLLTLSNGSLTRTVRFDPARGTWRPASLLLPGQTDSFVRSSGPEFSLSANGEIVTGATPDWTLGPTAPATDSRGGEGLTVTLTRPGLRVELTYLLYPGLPLTRKHLTVHNTGAADLRLEAVETESFLVPHGPQKGVIVSQYGRQKGFSPRDGNWDDPLVLVHDFPRNRGLAIGNEAPSVLKRTATLQALSDVHAGTTRPADPYPFRRWLAPGASWRSYSAFLIPYAGTHDPASGAWKSTLETFLRRHLIAPWPKNPPRFLYDSWIPFLENIREDLLEDLSVRAAQAGFDALAVDSGWYANQGDWEPDPKKFPHGLKPVFDRARQRGMQAGLWMSLAMADESSRAYREHPEWLLRNAAGQPFNAHSTAPGMASTCLGTAWFEHIRERIFHHVRANDLRYLKLDFGTVVSAYRHDPAHARCHAKDHPGHRDSEESLAVAFERMSALADEIRATFPELFLDITFEAWGKLQLIDYALVAHAHGDWMSNISEPVPSGSLQTRALAWSRSAAIPASAMIIGNLRTTEPRRILNFASVAGALPVMLGDLRQLDAPGAAELHRWADWFRAADTRHHVLAFRQDLPGYGEPADGQWDGYQRINTETRSGGIVGVFREGSRETTRRVFIDGLDPARRYQLFPAPAGASLGTFTGAALAAEGFPVTIAEQYGFSLFELRAAP